MRLGTIVALGALVVAGCVPVARPARTMSTARFDPTERDVVWARTLEELQRMNAVIAWANMEAGVIRTERQPGPAMCSGSAAATPDEGRPSADFACVAVQTLQITIAADGTAIWTTSRVVRGVTLGEDPLTPEDVAEFQRRQDAVLSRIVGAAARR
jgi:hypothetical protein